MLRRRTRSWWHSAPRSAAARTTGSATATRTCKTWGAPMSEQHIDYKDRDGNQARTAYTRTGYGTPVVLIHGVGLQGTIWKPQVEALRASHDVIAVDMPGHGGSSLPPANATLSHYADAILALLDALKVGRAHMV